MHRYSVYDILNAIWTQGMTSCPRGEEIKELHYFQGAIVHPWSDYKERNYSVDYFKREMQWYLNADPFDTRICEHAKVWTKLVQDDGRILSNYGYYWFNSNYLNQMKGWNGFDWVIYCLSNDPDSRQAYIPMNNQEHAFPGNADFVCTKGIQFRIIHDKLYCHVAMRSSDAIFGLATDLPCFWTLWCMVASKLDLPLGDMIFSADSVHIYERHYDMVQRILAAGSCDITEVHGPEVTDAEDLIQGHFESPFGKWLLEAKL